MPAAKTRATQNKLLRLENTLKRKLVKFYRNRIISNLVVPIALIRRSYDQELKDLIRKAVQDAYKVGADNVASAAEDADEDFILFISATDVNNIVELTNQVSDQFWRTVSRVQEKKELELTIGHEEKAALIPLSVELGAHIGALAVDAIFKSYNRTVTSKLSQVLPSSGAVTAARASGILLPGGTEPPPIPRLGGLQGPAEPFLPIGFEIKRVTPAGIGKVRFVTKGDAKVDPKICAPLDGMVWDIDDPAIIQPITDTHPYCRCTLEPFIETETGEEIDIGFDTSTAETAANEF